MVEWKKLGDLCEIKTGRLNANAQVENGQYPFFTCDANPYKIDKYAFDTEAIIISGNGSQVGHLNYYKGKFNTYQRTYVLDGFDGNIFYFYHYLKAVIRPYVMKKSMKGSVPYITLPMLTELPIPIPSLFEQSRIVSILDTFTDSIDNLKQQIEQRRKQYEHYRDQLLDLEGKEGVEMKTLRDLGSFFGGLTGKTKKDFEDGNAKFITYMNVFANPALDVSTVGMVRINEGEKQNKVQKGDILFTGSSETPEEAGMSCVITDELTEDFYMNSFCFGLRLTKPENYNLHYFKHLLRSYKIRQEISKSASGVTRFNISKARFGNILISVPSLEEQSRIVSILDTFEASIANLEEQLKLREKQYEYYRNKLLTFE